MRYHNGVWLYPESYVQTETEADREPLLTWKPKVPASHPVDYFVPDFGVDHDMIASASHI